MFKSIHKMKGQSTLEYAVLIMIIIAALLTIQTYVKRGIQGKMKSSADDIGDQFSPGNTKSNRTTHVKTKTQEVYGHAGQGVSTSTIDPVGEITNTTSNENIINTQIEYWGAEPKD